MKRKSFFNAANIFVALLVSSIFGNSLAQVPGVWETHGPLVSAEVLELIADPDDPSILYAGTFQRGVFRSADGGINWTQANSPMDDKTVKKIISVNGILYATAIIEERNSSGTQGTRATRGLYISTDRGINWTLWHLSDAVTVLSLMAVGDTVYAGTYSNGVYRSTDQGASWWQQANAPLNEYKSVNALLATSGTIYAGTGDSFSFIRGGREGIFFSYNSGIDWQQANAPMQDKYITALIAVSDTIYAGTLDHGVFKNTDKGMNWTPANSSMANKSVTALVTVKSTIYAGTEADGVFYSVDGGMNWSQAQSPMDKQRVTTLISVGEVLYAGTQGNGIFKSTDGGINWIQADAPLTDKGITALISAGSVLYTGTSRSGVFKNTDGSRQWFPTGQIRGYVPTTGLVVGENFMVAYGDGVFRSTDGGLTWSQANPPMNDKKVTKLILVGNMLFAGTSSDGVYRSSDGGVNWLQAAAPMNDKGISALLATYNELFAGTSRNGVFKSLDGGINWLQANPPMDNKGVTSIISKNDTLFVGTSSNGIFRSTDRGMNWTQANPPMQNTSVTALLAVDGKLYAGADYFSVPGFEIPGGILYSTDGGSNWTPVNPPIDKTFDIHQFFLLNGIIYVSCTANYPFRTSTLFRSIDKGENWEDLKIGRIATLTSADGELYAGTTKVFEFFGVFRSRDGGLSWIPLKKGLRIIKDSAGLSPEDELGIGELVYSPKLQRLYAATESGVYFQTLDSTPPQAVSINTNNVASFTKNQQISLILVADGADSMAISEDSTFSKTPWQEYKVNPSFALSNGDGAKIIYAKFKDFSWNESRVISAQITLDTAPPSFPPHTPPANATLGKSHPIKQLVNETNLEKMSLFYRRGGEPWNDDRTATFRADTALIDGAFVTPRGLDYRIIASDRAGQIDTLNNNSLDFFSIPVNIGVNEAGNSSGLPAGTGGSAYRLVSVPMKLGAVPNVTSVFGDFGKYGPDGDWRFWNYQGNGQWDEGGSISIQNGRGYLLILRNGGTLTNKVAGTTMETTAGVLGMIPGWHLRANDWAIIGNPYNFRIELSQLKLLRRGLRLSAQDTSFQVWAYDGSWKRDNLSLEPWGGLAIRATAADTIVFTNRSDPYARDLAKSQPASFDLSANLQPDEWIVQVRAENQDYSDQINYFGVRKGAREEQDVYDWYEPPILPGGISISFPHPEWPNPANFASDIRPPTKTGYEWRLVLKAKEGAQINLSFENMTNVPEAFTMFLLDENSGILRDLKKQPQITIAMPHGTNTKTLTILAGSQDFVNANSNGLSAIPQTFALQQNYPNPFNPTTVIRYELPVAGKVTLRVYDLQGREILTVENGVDRTAGFYETIVDLNDFAAGIYFYRLSVNGENRFEATKKMVLVR